MSCDRHYGIIGYPECSGNGQCVNGICVCNSDWSSIGDFEIVQGYDCDNHKPTLKYLAVLYMILSFPALLYEILVVLSIISSKRINAKHVSMLAAFVSNLCGYIYASLKIYDPDTYVLGKSLALSIIQSVMVSAVFSVGSIYALLSIRFLKGYYRMLGSAQQQQFKLFTARWKIVMNIAPYWGFFSSLILQIVGIYAVSPNNSDTINFVMSLLILENYMSHFWFIFSVGRMFMNELDTHLKGIDQASNKANDSHNTLLQSGKQIFVSKPSNINVENLFNSSKVIHFIGTNFFLNGSILYIIIVTWKFVRRKASYFIIVQLILMNMAVPFVLRALQNISNNHSKSFVDLIVKLQSSSKKSRKSSKSSRIAPMASSPHSNLAVSVETNSQKLKNTSAQTATSLPVYIPANLIVEDII